MMPPADLDALILSAASPRWQKVALLVARLAGDARFADGDAEAEPERIAARIAALVAAGKLRARGDVADWRFSEVCLSD